MNSNDVLQLLKQAYLNAGDQSSLDNVQKHAQEILVALEERDIEMSDEEGRLLADNMDWVARVYQVLGESAGQEDADREIDEALQTLRDDEDARIAHAFVSLVETLPGEFSEWDKWFGNVPQADIEFQGYIAGQRIVTESMPLSEGFIKYGLTPGTFADGSRSIQLMLDQVISLATGPVPESDKLLQKLGIRQTCEAIRSQIDSGMTPSITIPGKTSVDHRYIELPVRDSEAVVPIESTSYGAPGIPREALIAQMRTTPNCPPEAADPLMSWMIGAAQHKPFFFRGYQASTVTRGVIQLAKQPIEQLDDIELRWGRHASEVGMEREKVVNH